ncbi:hypothetical protein ACXYTJ_08480 [Gilvimarinus sp. F26214L]|uniref:hypothetical protein n=1 Tax=Gilvimarinus sp. DZF01 TaxID=3461371 RepID=UPI004045F679
MKLISHTQRAKVRYCFEIAASAVLSTIVVTMLVVIGTPGYMAATRNLVGI